MIGEWILQGLNRGATGAVIRWTATCLVFFGLPILILGFSLDRIWRQLERTEREEGFRSLDRTILALRRHEKTEIYLADLIRSLARRCRRPSPTPPFPGTPRGGDREEPATTNGKGDQGEPAAIGGERARERAALKAGIDQLRKRFPGLLRFTVADAEGNPIPELCDGNPPRAIVQRLSRFLRNPGDERDWNVVKRFVGPLSRASAGRHPVPGSVSTPGGHGGPLSAAEPFHQQETGFQEVSHGTRDRWFFAEMQPTFGIMVHATHLPSWPYLAIQDRCRIFRDRLGSDRVQVGLRSELDKEFPAHEIALAFGDYDRSMAQHHLIGGRLISLSQFTPSSTVWAARAAPAPWPELRPGTWWWWAGLLGFLLPSLAAARILWTGRSPRFPIRWRLVLLFAFAAGIPLSVVVLAGWDFLNRLQEARMSQEFDRNGRRLRALDAAFPRMIEAIQDRLTRLAKRHAFLDPARREALMRELALVRSRLAWPDALIVRNDRKVVWEVGPQTRAWEQVRNSLTQFTPILLRGVNAEGFQSYLIGAYYSSTDVIKDLVKSLGVLSEVMAGGTTSFQFLYPLTEPDQVARHILGLVWPRHALQNLFLERHLPRLQTQWAGMQLFALVGPQAVLPRSGVGIPPRLTRRVLSRFSQSEGIRGQTIRIAGRTFLLSLWKPGSLEGLRLGILEPEGTVKRELERHRRLLWGFTALSAGVSVFFGLFVAASFLVPIGNLAAGAGAMEARTFGHRLPPGDPDELGALSDLLNEVLAGMGELEVARIIQGSLFPGGETRTGACRLFGATEPMRQMGGDYFDIQPLPDGKVFLLIADVSGHGVQAGLVMAMAKALTIACLRQPGRHDPEQVLGFLQENLGTAIRIRWLMTCFAALLEPTTDTLIYANAGHRFPVLFRAGEAPQLLPIPLSMPLTSRHGRPRFGSGTLSLQAGDRLLLYTDGLVEAQGSDGAILEDDRIFAALAPLLEGGPEAACRAVRHWLAVRTGGAEPADDVTVLMLWRDETTVGNGGPP